MTSVFSIDLDNDGDNDVLSAIYNDNAIIWFENYGNGNFSSKKIITTNTNGAMDAFSIDIDGDNDNDILSASSIDNKIAWSENLKNSFVNTETGFCEGDSIQIGGQWISTQGIYNDTIPTFLGGDSILIVSVDEFLNPENFDIIGLTQVEKFSVQTYSVPANTDIEYILRLKMVIS